MLRGKNEKRRNIISEWYPRPKEPNGEKQNAGKTTLRLERDRERFLEEAFVEGQDVDVEYTDHQTS